MALPVCSLLKPTFKRMDNKYSEKKPAMQLVQSFFNPDQLHEPGMMDELLRGVAATSMETLDQVRMRSWQLTHFKRVLIFSKVKGIRNALLLQRSYPYK